MLPKVNTVLFSIILLTATSLTILAQAPTTADVMRDRISKAKAQLVVKNYTAAIYELENIRNETNDRTIHRMINVLLMHAYLEQGDYKRTQKFLTELFDSKGSDSSQDYLAVAGQVVSGSKTQLKRYQSLGLQVSDEKLPSYAVEDLEQMRKTLELIVEQSKTLGKDKRFTSNSMALLEETSNARGNLARDAYDAKRWENEILFARQQIASSGSTVFDALNDKTIEAPDAKIVAVSEKKENFLDDDEVERTAKTPDPVSKNNETAFKPVENKTKTESKPAVKEDKAAPNETDVAENKPAEKPEKKAETKSEKSLPLTNTPRPTDRPIRVIGSAERKFENSIARNDEETAKETPENTKTARSEEMTSDTAIAGTDKNPEDESLSDSPLTVGSLIGYATKRVNPVYPRQARTMRMTGVVKVEFVVDEDGNVSKVENTEGPSMLQRAAKDAIVKWQFRPFTRDGQPVKATGFVSFNFDM
ncbi:MAG: energy transducer TonB [Pyrinomonadaceae bacterium]